MTFKRATTITEQLDKFKKRGMSIDDYKTASCFLRHTSYYRLGSYSFPFEKSYPNRKDRSHKYKDNTLFSDVIELYQFDFELRTLLQKYLSIIEISIKTVVINEISNKYRDIPSWFVDTSVVTSQYAAKFHEDVFNRNGLNKNRTIIEHKNKYPEDVYPPAWKTIEYMTFGSVFSLYESLIEHHTKDLISKNYGLEINVFKSYIKSIRDLRNICAHGSVVFDYTVPYRFREGPAIKYVRGEKNTNIGRLSELIQYFLRQINNRIENEYLEDLSIILLRFKKNGYSAP